MQTDIEISKLRVNALYSHSQISQVQLEQESLDAMYQKRDELEQHISNLEIRAPQDGVVIARELELSTGKFLQPGDELLSIAKPLETQAIALARQSDIEWFEDNSNAKLQLRIWGRHEDAVIDGTIRQINPRARDDLPHEAFAANVGGPLAVVPRTQVEGPRNDSPDDPEMMLTELEFRSRLPCRSRTDRRYSLVNPAKRSSETETRTWLRTYTENFIRFVRNNNSRTHGL